MSHQIMLGVGLKSKNIESFLRYRLALLEKLVQNNIYIYLDYNKSFNVLNKLSITPRVITYLSYGKTKINYDILLK